jgi:hypothetical protein
MSTKSVGFVKQGSTAAQGGDPGDRQNASILVVNAGVGAYNGPG